MKFWKSAGQQRKRKANVMSQYAKERKRHDVK
jgi:hypothetical protein